MIGEWPEDWFGHEDIIGQRKSDPRFICPKCKQKRGVNISYGFPTEELFEEAERNEAVLGGCMQALGEDPDRQCLGCGHQWDIVRRRSLQDE